MPRKTKTEVIEGPKAGDDVAGAAENLVRVRRGKAVVASLSSPSAPALGGLKAGYLQALWMHARAKRVLLGASEAVKSQEIAVVEARRHRISSRDLAEVQEALAVALENRTSRKDDLQQRLGELKHAWEAYGAFEDQD